jgi:serine/threonine protein phosphatase 1
LHITLADLHGRSDLLEAAVARFPNDAHFVFLGDGIDRGPDSRGVASALLALCDAGRATLLLGNHEHMLLEAHELHAQWRDGAGNDVRVAARHSFKAWLHNGGRRTMREYGEFDEGSVPPELLEYLNRTVLSYRHGEVLCSHAAPPVAHPRYRNAKDVALWSRPDDGPFALPEGVRRTVHGHTPLAAPTWVGPHLYSDLGAVFTGALCAVDLDSLEITVLAGKGEMPLGHFPELTSDPPGLVRLADFEVVEV